MGIRVPLLSVGPESPKEDEQQIAKGYRSQGAIIAAVLMLTGAYFFDERLVMPVGFALVMVGLSAIDARLFDLCIRLRRANALLSEMQHSEFKD